MTGVLSCPMWILVTELINISSNNDPVLSSRFKINLFQCSYKGKFRSLICDCILYFFFVYVIVWISFPSINLTQMRDTGKDGILIQKEIQ